MTETERIRKAIDFFYNGQGYVELNLLEKMTISPKMVLKNVLAQYGFEESPIVGQYIKEAR